MHNAEEEDDIATAIEIPVDESTKMHANELLAEVITI